MRKGVVGLGSLVLALVPFACADQEHAAPTPKTAADPRGLQTLPEGPPQYVLADPEGRGNFFAVPLSSNGALGLVVDKMRVVVGRGEPSMAAEATEQTIGAVRRIPGRFGGGFLFQADSTLYRADTFEGSLKPIVHLPESISDFAFGPKFLLVRTQNGERWALGLGPSATTGERMPVDPLGVVDVEGLDDGRAVAYSDQGAAFTSTDHGAHWVDITTQMKSSPSRVAVVDEEIYLYESNGSALRLEPNGQVSSFDKQPPEKPTELRPRDPRWRGADAPIRAAVRRGALVGDNVALVVEQSDLVRVDLRTGEIVGVTAGKLPPDAQCEAVPLASDVLFACASRATNNGGGTAFVVSHSLGDAPVIEQTFFDSAQFFAGDDGGLAHVGPCAAATVAPSPSASPREVVCVRQPGGSWRELDLSALASDAGANPVNVIRWVPRADGRAVAFVGDPAPAIFDPHTGTLTTLPPEARATLVDSAPSASYRVRTSRHLGMTPVNVDTTWSFAPNGALRGWQHQGAIVEITEDGAFTRSPFSFDIVASGAMALGRSHEGRLFQSTDHGATWVEVLTPPGGARTVDLRGCSTAGCDLGAFYRIGWNARPPRALPTPEVARPAPDVRRTRPVELSCRPVGPPQQKTLPRTERSPDDLGLGMSRLAVAPDGSEASFIRNAVARGIVNPLHDTQPHDSDTPSLRALFSGRETTRSNGSLEVTGPNKNIRELRRPMSFLPAFDPGATVHNVSLSMNDIIGVGRATGMTIDDILSDDLTENGTIIVVTPTDPSASSDLAFFNARGLLAHVRPSDRVRFAMRQPQNDGVVISGATLAGDEGAFLELETSGVGHVYRVAAGGVTDLFDVNPTANDAAFYPANPDAIAVGPKGDVAILRTGSGSDPASELDPALLLVPAMPAVALAPWSTLRLSDEACQKEPGWRATLQVIAPWVRVTAPDLRVEDTPMLARVRWSEKKVCLEGLELQLPNISVHAGGPQAGAVTISSWLVSRGGSFARVAVGEGIEWRQTFECSIVATNAAAP